LAIRPFLGPRLKLADQLQKPLPGEADNPILFPGLNVKFHWDGKIHPDLTAPTHAQGHARGSGQLGSGGGEYLDLFDFDAGHPVFLQLRFP
jgi:hypothetical protein